MTKKEIKQKFIIADLEAKLAESEKTNFELREKYITTLNSDVIENSRLQKEINQLKQQLAEKDEKIATLMEAVDARDKEIDALKFKRKKSKTFSVSY